MKKYLVIVTLAAHVNDDNELTVNTTQLGSFDTVDECIQAAEDDLESYAKEVASWSYDPSDVEFDQAADEYLNYDKTLFSCLTDQSFSRVGADRIVLEHCFGNGMWQDNHTYTIIRIL